MQRADALSRQAADQRAAGDLPDAIALQSQSLTVRTAALGADSPDVAATQTNLAGLYAAADRYDEAEPLLRRALAIREKAYGADGRLTALSRNNLALLLAADGRSAEAELLYLQAIADLRARRPQGLRDRAGELCGAARRHRAARRGEGDGAAGGGGSGGDQEVKRLIESGRLCDEQRATDRGEGKSKAQKSKFPAAPFAFRLLPFAFCLSLRCSA